jgi:hypothetical protein
MREQQHEAAPKQAIHSTSAASRPILAMNGSETMGPRPRPNHLQRYRDGHQAATGVHVAERAQD